MNAPKKLTKRRSVVWRYLNQRVFSAKYKLVLNPFRFLLIYRIQLLEECLNKDYRIEQHRQQLQKIWNQDDAAQTPPSSNLGDRTQK